MPLPVLVLQRLAHLFCGVNKVINAGKHEAHQRTNKALTLFNNDESKQKRRPNKVEIHLFDPLSVFRVAARRVNAQALLEHRHAGLGLAALDLR